MSIDTQNHFIIPKSIAAALKSENTATLLTYAGLYTDSITDEKYDGITNEDGLKLFITLDTETISNETNLTNEQISASIAELQKGGFIRVVKQPNGRPPVIFVEPINTEETGNNADGQPDVPLNETTEPEHIYTPAETEIIGCWEEVFGDKPNQETITQLSEYLTIMDSSLLMLAIYDSEDDDDSVISKLEAYKQSGVKSVDDFKQEETEPEIAYNPIDNSAEVNQPQQEPEQNPEPPPISLPSPSTRMEALSMACDNTFKPTDINELWVSMQEVINEEKWNNYIYLYEWLRKRYLAMESLVKGGDRFVRMSKLIELITESEV